MSGTSVTRISRRSSRTFISRDRRTRPRPQFPTNWSTRSRWSGHANESRINSSSGRRRRSRRCLSARVSPRRCAHSRNCACSLFLRKRKHVEPQTTDTDSPEITVKLLRHQTRMAKKHKEQITAAQHQLAKNDKRYLILPRILCTKFCRVSSELTNG